MHFHKWTEWSKRFWRSAYVNAPGGGHWQTRWCTKCKKIETRRVYR